MQLSFVQTDRFSLNSSTSKQQYSFSKQKRFRQQNKKIQKGKFYTLPSTISFIKQKAPSFPKLVRRLQFPNQKSKRIVPSPSSYTIKSDIQKTVQSRQGISFVKQKMRVKKIGLSPGPTDYEPQREPFLTARYSMSKQNKKFEYPLELRKGNQSPGPAYLVNIGRLQKIVSKYVHTKSLSVYSQKNIKKKHILSDLSRSLNLKTKSSTRNIHSNLNPEGSTTIINTKLASRQLKNIMIVKQDKKKPTIFGKFSKQRIKSIFQEKNNSPGPGYNRFSQFSILQKMAYKKKLRQSNLKLTIKTK